MIKIENTETSCFVPAIRGMRNPMNSWDRSDSVIIDHQIAELGERDKDLMKRLAASGPEHAKFMRMMIVTMDVTAPLYWWKEFDTYKVGTVADSCSTMHKIAAKEFVADDFSHEHLITVARGASKTSADDVDFDDMPELAGTAITRDGEKAYYTPEGFLSMTCDVLNRYRKLYLETGDKKYWWQMIQLLPSSYNQRRTILLNYQVLANIYRQRRFHKLDEWRDFCSWIRTLPLSDDLIVGVLEQKSPAD